MVNDYWKKRIEAEQKARIERDATLGQEMKRLYDYHFSELEKEIRAFEQRYADKNNIPLSEVKARVSDIDVRAFEEKAKRYVAEKNFSAKANAELSLYNLKMKTSRLELLQYQMDLELLALSNGEHQLTEKFLNEEYIKELDVQAGLLGRSVLSASQIAQVAQTTINTPFKGAVWSDKIWQRQSALREIVARVTEDYLLKGKNPTTMISQLRKEFDVSVHQAKRLAVTEGARVASEAQKQAFSANGYDEYEFIAEPGACGICKPLDGKIFKVKDMEPGLNASPMHPFCRCATAAHFSMSEEEYERLIRESAESRNGSLFGMSARSKETWPGADKNNLISKEDRNALTDFASQFGIKIQGLKKFDGDIAVLREFVEESGNVLSLFPSLVFDSRRPLTLSLANLADDDFGITRGHVIELNKAMFRDKALLEKRYQDLVDEGWFAKGTNYKSIIHHEMGHVIDDKLKLDNLGIAESIAGDQVEDLMDYLREHLSEYASSFEDGIEIPSEALSSFMGNSPSVFAVQFVKEMLKYR